MLPDMPAHVNCRCNIDKDTEDMINKLLESALSMNLFKPAPYQIKFLNPPLVVEFINDGRG